MPPLSGAYINAQLEHCCSFLQLASWMLASTMRFESTTKVLAKRSLQYYRISQCLGRLLLIARLHPN